MVPIPADVNDPSRSSRPVPDTLSVPVFVHASPSVISPADTASVPPLDHVLGAWAAPNDVDPSPVFSIRPVAATVSVRGLTVSVRLAPA